MLDQELVDGFKQESYEILGELNQILEKLEEPQKEFPTELLSDFSQRIDRIMGAAKTILQFEPEHLGFKRIGQIAELCKSLGYKAGETKRSALVPIFAAFWADTIDVINDLLAVLEDPEESKKIAEDFSAVLTGRLEWLSKKVVQQQAPIAGNEAPEIPEKFDVESLLKDLGF